MSIASPTPPTSSPWTEHALFELIDPLGLLSRFIHAVGLDLKLDRATMPPPSSSFNCITFTLLVLPAVVLTIYLLTSFPHVPESVTLHSSLASLVRGVAGAEGQGDLAARVGAIYPEGFWAERASAEVGGYVSLPFGKTRYWIIGPEDGMKVCSRSC